MGTRRHRSRLSAKNWIALGSVAVLVASVTALTAVALQPAPLPSSSATLAPVPTFDSATERPARVLFLGDSYTSGTTIGGVGEDGWPVRSCAMVGCNATVGATGGAGFIGGEDVDRGITAQLEAVPGTITPNVIVLALGANDYGTTIDDLRPRVDEVLETIASRWPDAQLVVLGPFWRNDTPAEVTIALDQYLEQKANERGAPFASPLREGWLTGLIGSDNVHPESAGHEAVAERVSPILIAAGADQTFTS